MTDKNWRFPKKIYDRKNRNTKSRGHIKSKDELIRAHKDLDRLKRKKKRLSIDWFFRPRGD